MLGTKGYVQQTRRALGSEVQLTLVAQEAIAESLLADLWRQIDQFEARFSRFLPDSELSRFNAHAGEWVQISPEFEDILRSCLEHTQQTDGWFDPLVLPELQRAGYVGSWPTPEVHHPATDYRSRRRKPGQHIKIGPLRAKIPAQSALDLGGIGKGYLLDELAISLAKSSVDAYCLSLGGDILCGGTDPSGDAWTIPVDHVSTPEPATTFILTPTGHQAVATSGVTKRRGVAWHHLIDPNTGTSSETDILSASIVHNSAASADVLAKCVIMQGSEKAVQWAKDHGAARGIIQVQQQRTVTVIEWGSHD